MNLERATWAGESDDQDIEVQAPGWMSVFGSSGTGRRRAGRRFEEGLDLGEHMKLKVRSGFRATSVKLADGQYLVAAVPERDFQVQGENRLAYGFIDTAAKSLESIVSMIIKAAKKKKPPTDEGEIEAPAAAGWRW